MATKNKEISLTKAKYLAVRSYTDEFHLKYKFADLRFSLELFTFQKIHNFRDSTVNVRTIVAMLIHINIRIYFWPYSSSSNYKIYPWSPCCVAHTRGNFRYPTELWWSEKKRFCEELMILYFLIGESLDTFLTLFEPFEVLRNSSGIFKDFTECFHRNWIRSKKTSLIIRNAIQSFIRCWYLHQYYIFFFKAGNSLLR